MLQTVFNGTKLAAQTLATTTSQSFNIDGLDYVCLQVNYSNATTGAKTFTTVSTTNDTATITAHGQVLGSVGQLTTSSALPTGLSTSTNYYIIPVDANTVKFATSLANAVAGTAVDITGAGTGTQTFTPTTSASNVIKAQASVDGVTFTDITTSNGFAFNATVTVSTSTGGVVWPLGVPEYKWVNILYTPSSGQINFSVLMNAKNSK